MTEPHLLPGPLIVPPELAETYLRAMDVDVRDLYAAVGAGEKAAGAVDAFAPHLAPGILRWIEVVSTLRRRLTASGDWVLGDRRGQPICRHLRSGRTLAIFSGDLGTGKPESPFGPRTVRRKGAATAESFNPDEVLFPLSELRPRRRSGGVLAGTWVFLYRWTGETVHMEISQPTGFDAQEGQFTGWTVRVILDDWRPAGRQQPPLDLAARRVDLQLFREAS